LDGLTAPVRSVAISRDGARAISVTGDNMSSLWDAATGGRQRIDRGAYFAAAFAPDGTWFVSGVANGGFRATDPGSNRLHVLGNGSLSNFVSVTVAPDGSFALAGTENGQVVPVRAVTSVARTPSTPREPDAPSPPPLDPKPPAPTTP